MQNESRPRHILTCRRLHNKQGSGREETTLKNNNNDDGQGRENVRDGTEQANDHL